MLIKLVVFLIVFGGAFYLANAGYPMLEEFLKHWHQGRIDKITPRLDEMFLDIPLKKIIMLDILAPLGCGVLGLIITHSLLISAGFLVGGLIIPFLVIKNMEARRKNKFSAQLVDGLTILSSSLKAGLSLQQSIEVLVEEMPPPIGQEFSLVLRQMQMGVSLEEAMYSLKKRMRLDELDIMVTAIMVARESGGDLTVTFAQLIHTIQERNKLVSRVSALTAQGKLQGIIMSILPILFGLFVYKINPKFFEVFFTDGLGKMLFYYAIVSEILGIFFIRKLSKVDI